MHVLPCSGWRFSSTALSIASKKIWLAHASQNGIGVWCSSHERGLKNVKAEGVVPRHAAYASTILMYLSTVGLLRSQSRANSHLLICFVTYSG